MAGEGHPQDGRRSRWPIWNCLERSETETQSVALDDLVVVAEFRDTIYPGLVSTGKV